MFSFLDFSYNNFATMDKYQCDICEKDFVSKYVFARHLKEMHMHSKRDETNYCDLCDKVFINIRGHKMSVHENIRNFTCDICDKSFCYSKDLRRHYLSVHYKSKPYRYSHKFTEPNLKLAVSPLEC